MPSFVRASDEAGLTTDVMIISAVSVTAKARMGLLLLSANTRSFRIATCVISSAPNERFLARRRRPGRLSCSRALMCGIFVYKRDCQFCRNDHNNRGVSPHRSLLAEHGRKRGFMQISSKGYCQRKSSCSDCSSLSSSFFPLRQVS